MPFVQELSGFKALTLERCDLLFVPRALRRSADGRDVCRLHYRVVGRRGASVDLIQTASAPGVRAADNVGGLMSLGFFGGYKRKGVEIHYLSRKGSDVALVLDDVPVGVAQTMGWWRTFSTTSLTERDTTHPSEARPVPGPHRGGHGPHGRSARDDPETDDPGWKPFQDAYLTYRSEGKSYAMAVHWLWGANRDGVIKVDVARRSPGRGPARRIYGGVRSWQWCALAPEPRSGEPCLLVAGYPETSPLETTFFKLRGERLIPYPEGARSASLKALDVACRARAESLNEHPCFEARCVKGKWRLRTARAVRTRRPSPKPTVARNHG